MGGNVVGAFVGAWWYWVLLGRHRLRDSGAEDGEGTVVLASLSLCRDRADEVSVR
jgi:hypothetical protein